MSLGAVRRECPIRPRSRPPETGKEHLEVHPWQLFPAAGCESPPERNVHLRTFVKLTVTAGNMNIQQLRLDYGG